MKISIIGFGYIGSVMSAVLADLGHSITAIDNNSYAIDELNEGICLIPEPNLHNMISSGVAKGLIKGSSDFKDIKGSEVILVTVGTPLSDSFDADLSALRSVFSELKKYVISGQTIMIKSTVPPGTTRLLAEEFLADENVFVAFSPERLAEGNAIEEFTQLPIVVGGINEESTKECSNFWRNIFQDVDVMEVSSSEAAEMVKLADNQWIDLNIALANELAILCDSIPGNIDVMEVIESANSLKKGMHYVNILYPSIGVGGYCLTKDPWFLDAFSRKMGTNINLPSQGRKANELMPGYAFSKINNFMQRYENYKEKKVSILGYSFKSNSGDVRFTPMEQFIKLLLKEGFNNIHIYDPMVSDKDILSDKNLKIHSDWTRCIENSSCLIYGVAHDVIKDISTGSLIQNLEEGAMVFDGRLYMKKEDILELKEANLHYQGIGRSF